MATDETSHNVKDYFNPGDPEINEQMRKILTQNGIPEDQLVSHVRAVVRKHRPEVPSSYSRRPRETKAGPRSSSPASDYITS